MQKSTISPGMHGSGGSGDRGVWAGDEPTRANTVNTAAAMAASPRRRDFVLFAKIIFTSLFLERSAAGFRARALQRGAGDPAPIVDVRGEGYPKKNAPGGVILVNVPSLRRKPRYPHAIERDADDLTLVVDGERER